MSALARAAVIGLIVSLLFLAAAGAPPPPLESGHHPGVHAGAAEPGFFHQELENAQVQVVRINIPAHARIPEHEVSPRVVVWLRPAHLRMRFPDGTVRDESHHAGEVGWTVGTRHAGENLGDQPIEFIAIVPKNAAR